MDSINASENSGPIICTEFGKLLDGTGIAKDGPPKKLANDVKSA